MRERRHRNDTPDHGRPVRALLQTTLPALLLVVLARTLLFGLYRVPSHSMEDTIRTGDYILGERMSYRLRQPVPGEIVTFESPEEPGVTLVKRVVATEGQVVDVRDGEVYVDGRPSEVPSDSSQPARPQRGQGEGLPLPSRRVGRLHVGDGRQPRELS